MLADRLRRLAAAGLVTRVPAPGDRRPALCRPTPAARSLVPALVAPAYWGASHGPATGTPAAFRASCEADREALVRAMLARSEE